MQVVILAGGLGTRLRPITERIPKPMVEVAGRPFLEYIVCHLAEQGFCRLLLLLGYLGHQVHDHFGDGSQFGISIDYAIETAPLGTAGSVRNALDKLDEKFLLLYGDSFLPIDYCAVARAFEAADSSGLVVVYDNCICDTGVSNNVALNSDGTVGRYEKNSDAQDLRYVEAGVLCLRRELFAALPPGRPISLEYEIYPRLIAARQFRAFITPQRFFDIGTPDRLQQFAAVCA